MKNKGFTLIELLAVIVILAIIALIATPIILNVIDTSKKGAVESSMLGVVDAIEKQVMLSEVDSSATSISKGTYTMAQLTNMKVEVKGDLPDDTSVFTINNKGQVSEGWATFYNGEYKVYYDGKYAVADKEDYKDSKGDKHNDIATPGGGPTIDLSDIYSTANVKQLGVKGIAYLDPTNLKEKCNASNSVSTSGTKTGCMKWYIYDDNSNNYTMILDHNTTSKIACETSGTYNEYASASIKIQVDTDTTGWVSGLNPRLITANEIATITNTTTFTGLSGTAFYLNGSGDKKQTKVSSTQGDNEYAWLFDYTKDCTNSGCNIKDSSTNGYWTSSSTGAAINSRSVWNVDNNGHMGYYFVGYDDRYGIRPVITVSKSIFN